ncbi:MAG TPA: hypothetical protein DEO60_03645, partial [Bacteroidales bacterium]|nr:hypothetical protein [Bacteroidales bacterium]
MERIMKINKIKIYVTLAVLMAGFLNVLAQDWPQYLGPKRNGTSDQKGILRTWPEKGPDVLWT